MGGVNAGLFELVEKELTYYGFSSFSASIRDGEYKTNPVLHLEREYTLDFECVDSSQTYTKIVEKILGDIARGPKNSKYVHDLSANWGEEKRELEKQISELQKYKIYYDLESGLRHNQ